MAYRAMWFNAGYASDWKPGDPKPADTATGGPAPIDRYGHMGASKEAATTLEEARRRLLVHFDTIGVWASGLGKDPVRQAMLRVHLRRLEPGAHVRAKHLVYWIEEVDAPLP